MRTNPLKEFSCYEYLFLSIINMLLSSENIASILFFFFLPQALPLTISRCIPVSKTKDFRLKMKHTRYIIKNFTQIYVSYSEKSSNNQTTNSKLELVTTFSTSRQKFILKLPNKSLMIKSQGSLGTFQITIISFRPYNPRVLNEFAQVIQFICLPLFCYQFSSF